MTIITLEQVKSALTLPNFDPSAAHRAMAPTFRAQRRERSGDPKLAAVLILLYPAGADHSLTFPLMQRTEYPGVHSGQISLPGGSCDPGESWAQTALRETCEEFGVCEGITVLGELSEIYVAPSDFEIHPIVGAISTQPHFKADPVEVAAILEVPVHDLLDHSIKSQDEHTLVSGEVARVPGYKIGVHKVWGATAIILSELEHRLRAIL